MNTDAECDVTISLILDTSKNTKISSCAAPAQLERVKLTYLRLGLFDDADGISDCSPEEVLNTTIWELQRAALEQLGPLIPHDPQVKLWKEKLPSPDDLVHGDTLYLRRGPADDALLTHLFLGVKGGRLVWITGGKQLLRMLREAAAGIVDGERPHLDLTFCLRPAPVAPVVRPSAAARSTTAAAAAGAGAGRGRGRPPAQERRVAFEVSVGTKQTGVTCAPKFFRTNVDTVQKILPWNDVPHTVRAAISSVLCGNPVR